ncbi:MAG: hypothetical protein A3K19_30845 [Lentisphaerae bacterium RIFOXYB12_FULL_65_16]|nr:MAG: hypothetical protein A3K18_04050 [Lentisphaerae bacterium RIFOXYA12_64_32]OGV88816.1 MAG: hypothetical protein A3K19_30845 [Lentisphaerae bacterium RIFOXYB12_FULL_65_16]
MSGNGYARKRSHHDRNLASRLSGASQREKHKAEQIRSHFSSGGQQMQFNLVNREMLLDAKAHPEKYGDLMVRVAGRSAPFTALSGDLQDEIIARTEHTACG